MVGAAERIRTDRKGAAFQRALSNNPTTIRRSWRTRTQSMPSSLVLVATKSGWWATILDSLETLPRCWDRNPGGPRRPTKT
jgi:hypothetical protein